MTTQLSASSEDCETTTCTRARGCAGSHYPFLTQKERDVETGLDYFLARYYSSTQGRFTSPDEFTGGPDELFDFSAVAAGNPTFYADLTQPQSLNKYHYCLNNPLIYVDPDGHQQALTQRLMLERGPNPAGSVARSVGGAADMGTDVITGIGKGIGNVGIGINNLMADFKVAGAEHIEPYEGSNTTQKVAMVVTEDVTLFAGLLGGKPQVGGVAVAEAKTTTVVAAEAGNATRGAASAKAIPKQGIYEFPDAATGGGRIYVGQSGRMPNRLREHARNGRIAPGASVSTQEILGGKLPRERAEQARINRLGGTRNVPGSRTSNIRNPIGRKRRDQALPD